MMARMAELENPALKHFVAQIRDDFIIAQVLIRHSGAGYELCHMDDASVASTDLRPVKSDDARALAQSTAAGEFRPLKSAPTLQRGWRLLAKNDAELDSALSRLYPGALADWYAAQSPNPPVTHYRDYTGRQSGMYRITTMLNDAQVAAVIGAVCDAGHCLKRRLWTVAGTESDPAPSKSIIPCLEPCAILMEAARVAVRAAQQDAETTLATGPKEG
jgi:hypothetical protein